eukprot:TRINITY_DN20093_c0_g1_i1.p1 TRINITY_DN20093_c0_g1~~TRINITY_DN20093_c0_g1_i1.p1  ORF type:complete len:231 (-),score=77.54 TRINITY_DN20093_c0_g1_i1:25-717(-)
MKKVLVVHNENLKQLKVENDIQVSYERVYVIGKDYEVKSSLVDLDCVVFFVQGERIGSSFDNAIQMAKQFTRVVVCGRDSSFKFLADNNHVDFIAERNLHQLSQLIPTSPSPPIPNPTSPFPLPTPPLSPWTLLLALLCFTLFLTFFFLYQKNQYESTISSLEETVGTLTGTLNAAISSHEMALKDKETKCKKDMEAKCKKEKESIKQLQQNDAIKFCMEELEKSLNKQN